jgi:hypothetical protein
MRWASVQTRRRFEMRAVRTGVGMSEEELIALNLWLENECADCCTQQPCYGMKIEWLQKALVELAKAQVRIHELEQRIANIDEEAWHQAVERDLARDD